MTSPETLSFSEFGSAQTDLVTTIVQQFRASLTTLLGEVDLLFDQKLSASDHDSYLLRIKQSGRRLITQMNDVLDLTKIESGDIRAQCGPVCPIQQVGGVLQSFQELALAKGLTLSAQPIGPIPQTILSDPKWMRQVLFNLIGNAIKFTETGGIVVTIRMADYQASCPQLAIDVIDTGVGIASQRIHRIFGPVTNGEQIPRTMIGFGGIGLILSRRIARLLGGDLVVSSILGQGSTFTWTIATGSLEGIPVIHPRDDAAACIS